MISRKTKMKQIFFFYGRNLSKKKMSTIGNKKIFVRYPFLGKYWKKKNSSSLSQKGGSKSPLSDSPNGGPMTNLQWVLQCKLSVHLTPMRVEKYFLNLPSLIHGF